MDTSKRPSGWLRLWVLIGALYAIVVVIMALVAWPSGDSGINTYEAIDNETGEAFEFDFHGFTPPNAAEMSAIRHEQRLAAKPVAVGDYISSDPLLGLAEVTKVEIQGRPPVYFRKNTFESTIERAVDLHVNGPWPERLRFVVWAFVAWAVPMAFVFALGRGIGWVVRGFRHQ